VTDFTCGIAGLGWVTPLGNELRAVADAIAHGAVVLPQRVANPETGREHFYLPVAAEAVGHLTRHPRLRRSSVISYFAVAAAEAALADAEVTVTPEIAARTAIVLAVSNGGVVYTRRFYEQIAKGGASSASPLLFPETVYNAPASHLAAVLGIDGATYTLVGDNSIGLSALHFGAQLIALGEADHCLVVGSEELDWILCEAYRDWRLTRTPLAEGAGAILLARRGPLQRSTSREKNRARAFSERSAGQPPIAISFAQNPIELFAADDQAVVRFTERNQLCAEMERGEADRVVTNQRVGRAIDAEDRCQMAGRRVVDGLRKKQGTRAGGATFRDLLVKTARVNDATVAHGEDDRGACGNLRRDRNFSVRKGSFRGGDREIADHARSPQARMPGQMPDRFSGDGQIEVFAAGLGVCDALGQDDCAMRDGVGDGAQLISERSDPPKTGNSAGEIRHGFSMMIEAFVPPNPNEFEITRVTGAARASFATTSIFHDGSGVS